MKQETVLRTKKALTYVYLVILALISAVNYQLFIFPNRFAPAGLNGLCTMVQYVFGISVSSLNLLINLPLAYLVYRKFSHSIAVRSMVYVLCFSLFLSLLDWIDRSALAYSTENGTSTILGPLVAGIINGTIVSQLSMGGAYTGGTDFIACLIRRKRPGLNFFGVIFALNAVVAVISFFVYDFQVEPVILCILYCFMSSTVSDKVVKFGRQAVRFEIITDHPEELSQLIIQQLHHSATLVPAKGMYSGRETNMLICVINKAQVSALSSIVRQFPHTFAVMSSASAVMGNFKHLNTDGKESKDLLDMGDTSAV